MGDSPGFDGVDVATTGWPATSVPGCCACELGGVSPCRNGEKQEINVSQSMKDVIFYVKTTGYLKNHWTKHRHVCIHFDAFSMLISNSGHKA